MTLYIQCVILQVFKSWSTNMFGKILTNINWIDILVGCIFVRGIYIGITRGLIVEAFKFVGMLFAIFIGVHYYVILAQKLHSHFAVPTRASEILAVVIIWIAVVLVFKIIRDGWIAIFKAEPHPSISGGGGALLAFLRSILVCSLIFLLLFLLKSEYLTNKVRTSYTGKYVIEVPFRIYDVVYDGFVGKLFPDEKKNLNVFKIEPKESKKRRK